MSSVKSITVGKVAYNVAQAPADKGKKLLLLIGSKIAYNSAAGGVKTIDLNVVIGAIMSLPEPTFDEVAQIVLYKTVKNGGDQLINVGDFQGKPFDYLTLVAEAVRFNLEDFFTFLDNVNEETRTNKQKPILQ